MPGFKWLGFYHLELVKTLNPLFTFRFFLFLVRECFFKVNLDVQTYDSFYLNSSALIRTTYTFQMAQKRLAFSFLLNQMSWPAQSQIVSHAMIWLLPQRSLNSPLPTRLNKRRKLVFLLVCWVLRKSWWNRLGRYLRPWPLLAGTRNAEEKMM